MLGFPIPDLTRKMWAWLGNSQLKCCCLDPVFKRSSMMVIEVYQCIMLIGWSFSLGSGHRRPLQDVLHVRPLQDVLHGRPLQNVLHVFGGCGQIANAFQRPGRKSMYGKIHPHIPETFRYITSTRTVVQH